MRVLRAFKILNSTLSVVHKQAITLMLTVTSIIFLMAGLMNLLENQLFEQIMGYPPTPPLISFGDALYFSVVTIATVGYGDIAPVTPIGRAVDMIFIVTAIIIVPMQVNRLGELIALQSKFKITIKPEASEVPHLLIVGNVQREYVLREFLQELYHPDRTAVMDERIANRRTIVMGPDEPTDGIKVLLLHPLFDGRVTYVRGSVMLPEDLYRVAADQADACFVLGDVCAADPVTEDRATALRVLMVKTYAPQVQIFVHLQRAQALSHMTNGVEVTDGLIVEEWKARLLAQASVVPGFSTLINNLVRTYTPLSDDGTVPPWRLEYTSGAAKKVYHAPVPHAFDGRSFSELARAVYETWEGSVLVWGVRDPTMQPDSQLAMAKIANDNKRRGRGSCFSTSALHLRESGGVAVRGRVIMNPGPTYRLQAGQMMYVVADYDAVVEELMDPDVFERYAFKQGEMPAFGRQNNGYGFPVPERQTQRPVLQASPAADQQDSYAPNHPRGLDTAVDTGTSDAVWTWGRNGEQFDAKFQQWFGDYQVGNSKWSGGGQSRKFVPGSRDNSITSSTFGVEGAGQDASDSSSNDSSSDGGNDDDANSAVTATGDRDGSDVDDASPGPKLRNARKTAAAQTLRAAKRANEDGAPAPSIGIHTSNVEPGVPAALSSTGSWIGGKPRGGFAAAVVAVKQLHQHSKGNPQTANGLQSSSSNPEQHQDTGTAAPPSAPSLKSLVGVDSSSSPASAGSRRNSDACGGDGDGPAGASGGFADCGSRADSAVATAAAAHDSLSLSASNYSPHHASRAASLVSNSVVDDSLQPSVAAGGLDESASLEQHVDGGGSGAALKSPSDAGAGAGASAPATGGESAKSQGAASEGSSSLDIKKSLKSKLAWDRIRNQVERRATEMRKNSIVAMQRARERRFTNPSLVASGAGNGAADALSVDDSIHPEQAAQTAKKAVLADFASIAEAAGARSHVLKSVILKDVRNADVPIHSHVIVCCTLQAFRGFLAPMRSTHVRGTALHKQVVLLTQYDESAAAHESIEDIAYFGGVAVVIGSASNPADLLRAGISSASCLILLTDRADTILIDGQAMDSTVIFSYLVLEQVLTAVPTQPSFYVMVELSTMGNLHVLNSKRLSKLALLHKAATEAAKALAEGNYGPGTTIGSQHNQMSVSVQANGRGLRSTPSSSLLRKTPSANGSEARSGSQVSMTNNGDGVDRSSQGKIELDLTDVTNIVIHEEDENGYHDVDSAGGLTPMTPASSSGATGGINKPSRLTLRTVESQSSQEGIFGKLSNSNRSTGMASFRKETTKVSLKRTMSKMNPATLMVIGKDGKQIGAPDSERNLGNAALRFKSSGDLKSAIVAAAAADDARKLREAQLHALTTDVFSTSKPSYFKQTVDLSAQSPVFNLPFFAAGYAYPVDILHTTLVTAYYDPETIRFAEELVCPDPGEGSRLFTEPVPRRFHSKPFRWLFSEMLGRYGAIVVGLYRCPAAAGSSLPYVYTCPAANAPVFSTDEQEDMMYVLASRPLFVGPHALAPQELVGMEELYDVRLPPASSAASASPAGQQANLGGVIDRAAASSDFGAGGSRSVSPAVPLPSLDIAIPEHLNGSMGRIPPSRLSVKSASPAIGAGLGGRALLTAAAAVSSRAATPAAMMARSRAGSASVSAGPSPMGATLGSNSLLTSGSRSVTTPIVIGQPALSPLQMAFPSAIRTPPSAPRVTSPSSAHDNAAQQHSDAGATGLSSTLPLRPAAQLASASAPNPVHAAHEASAPAAKARRRSQYGGLQATAFAPAAVLPPSVVTAPVLPLVSARLMGQDPDAGSLRTPTMAGIDRVRGTADGRKAASLSPAGAAGVPRRTEHDAAALDAPAAPVPVAAAAPTGSARSVTGTLDIDVGVPEPAPR